jgi:O-succinylbenzoic acid--CoA ligase
MAGPNGGPLMRELRVVAADEGLVDALRSALAGGHAILPTADGMAVDVPAEVGQRVALVVETSGSTGTPKRVALSADAVLANAAASESALGGPGQWVLALPTHYIAGINVLVRSLAADTLPVVVGGDHFSARAFLAAVDRMTIPERYVALVPAQLTTLLDDAAARDALRGFGAVLVGGQATPDAIHDRAADAGIRVVRSYGASETSGGCVYDGRPIGTALARVMDGEVWLGGPTVAEGYLGDEASTAERFADEAGVRWFRTADAGSYADGVLHVTGRRDAVLVSGGIKVALGEVERVLREQPGFGDAVVVAGADERWGETPVAFTTGRGDAHAAIDAVRAALGPAARPRIVWLPQFPALPSGKPDRGALGRFAAG